jgi:uroporphyrinogen decarboxylase
MNDRQRFNAIMHYRPFDRCVIQDFQYWQETIDAWHCYGLPKDVNYGNAWEFFGFDRLYDSCGGNVMLCPAFETKVLSEDDHSETVQQGDGTVIRRLKHELSSIPTQVDHVLKDRASWEAHFKWRLDPAHPDRLPGDLDGRLADLADSKRTFPLSTGAGSIFGQLRNWMGIEGVSYIQADDPKLFAEMIQTIGACIVGTLRRVLQRASKAGVTFDYAGMWEDMAYSHGPLLGVPAFEALCVPQYQGISRLLKEYGTDLVVLDCDGDPRLLYPGWLKGGVNVAFPLEVGVWGNEPVSCRRRFGKEMRILGGFSKRILAASRDAIAREIDRLAPLVEEGGFIPFCDHRVPPDVSLENYLYYVRRAKQVWGKGLANLRPTGSPDTSAAHYGKPYDYRVFLKEKAAIH